MQTVRLVGNISKFGEVWETDCKNVRDIFKLIDCQTPDFRKYLIEAAEAGVSYEIQRGNVLLDYPEELLLDLKEEDIVITEIPAGAKSGPAKIIAGIILFIVAGPASGALQNFLYGMSASLIIGGITQMLVPGVEGDSNEVNEGWLFTGANNNISQGMPIPVAYGELLVGGAPISLSYEPYDPDAIADAPTNAGSTGDGTFDPDPDANGAIYVATALNSGLNWSNYEPKIAPPGSGTSSDPYLVEAGDGIGFVWIGSRGYGTNRGSYGTFDPADTNNIWVQGTARVAVARQSDAFFTVAEGDGTEKTNVITINGYSDYTLEDPPQSTYDIHFKRVAAEAAPVPSETNAKLFIDGPATVLEGQTTGAYTVALVDSNGDSISCTQSVVVSLSYTNSTANTSSDFTPVSSVTIPANSSSATFTLNTTADTVAESGEAIRIDISTSSGGGFNSLTVDTSAGSTDYFVVTSITEPGTAEPPAEDEDDAPSTEDYTITTTFTPGPAGSLTVTEDIPGAGTQSDLLLVKAGDVIKIDNQQEANNWNFVVASATIFTENKIAEMDKNNPVYLEIAEGAANQQGSIAIVSGNRNVELLLKRQTEGQTSTPAKLQIVGPSSVLEGSQTTNYSLKLIDSTGQPILAKENLPVSIAYSGTATRGTDYTTTSAPTTRTILANTSSLSYNIATQEGNIGTGGETIIQTISTSSTGGFSSLTVDSNKNSVTTTIEEDTTPSTTISVGSGTVFVGNTLLGEDGIVTSFIQFNTNGSISIPANAVQNNQYQYSDTSWSSSTNTNINSEYEIKVSLTSGNLSDTNATIGQEYNKLDKNLYFYISDNTADSTATSATLSIAIRKVGTSSNLATATVTLSASNTYVPDNDDDTDQPGGPSRDTPPRSAPGFTSGF